MLLALNAPCFAVEEDDQIGATMDLGPSFSKGIPQEDGSIIFFNEEAGNTANQSDGSPIATVGPDLRVEYILFTGIVCPGNPFDVSVGIKNAGDTNVTSGFYVDFFTNAPTVLPCYSYSSYYCSVPGLAAGAEYECKVATGITLSSGNYTFRAFVDSGCSIVESNETNNQLAFFHAVYTLPDLYSGIITIEPPTPIVGLPATVSVSASNFGCADAGGFYIDFYKNRSTDPPCYTVGDSGCYVNSLANLASYTCTKTVTFDASGSFTLSAKVDTDCAVSEQYETNNFTTKSITVIAPDLIVKSITTNPPIPNSGDIVTLGITFANMGAAAAPNGFYLDFYKNRATAPPLGLAGNAYQYFPPNMPCCGYEYTTYDITMIWDTCGTNKMWAQIDTDNDNIEENESNNVFGPQNITICGNCPSYDIIRSMVRQYYLSILDREPDVPGWDFWTNDICRISTEQGCEPIDKLGIYIGEGFQALARFHFNSPEYIAKGKNNTQFLTDCYEVFLERAPDGAGLTFWLDQMSQGYTRNMVITSFANSPEYIALMTGYFGIDTTRPENNLLNDLYRGILNRFPENEGFKFWLELMHNAQCAGNPVALKNLCGQIAVDFTHSAEYAARGRNCQEFVEDLYNAILRRGADAPGFVFWVNLCNSGYSRDAILQEFINGPEFQGRVQTVVDAGCCGVCAPAACGSFTNCNPINPNCFCFEVAEGGGHCATDFLCSNTPCPAGTVDCPAGQRCYVNTCCAGPVCGPAECTVLSPAIAAALIEGELTAAGVTPVIPADKIPW